MSGFGIRRASRRRAATIRAAAFPRPAVPWGHRRARERRPLPAPAPGLVCPWGTGQRCTAREGAASHLVDVRLRRGRESLVQAPSGWPPQHACGKRRCRGAQLPGRPGADGKHGGNGFEPVPPRRVPDSGQAEPRAPLHDLLPSEMAQAIPTHVREGQGARSMQVCTARSTMRCRAA